MDDSIVISDDGSQYIGKRLLVGITVHNADGEFLYQEQFHGPILEADREGIVIKRSDNGARVVLPPELKIAPPGNYRLRSTGEIIENPDYIATWSWTEGNPDSDHDGPTAHQAS